MTPRTRFGKTIRRRPIRMDERHLGFERLEQRYVLSSLATSLLDSAPIVEQEEDVSRYDVRVRLEATGIGESDSVRVGEKFLVRAYVQDLRTAPDEPEGVFAAFADVLYDPETVRPTDMVHYADVYSVARMFDFCRGGIDDVGAASHSIRPLGDQERFLFEIVFEAIAPGNASFVLQPSPHGGTDVLIYDSNDGVPHEQVEYLGTEIEVREGTTVVDTAPLTEEEQELLDRIEAAQSRECTPGTTAESEPVPGRDATSPTESPIAFDPEVQFTRIPVEYEGIHWIENINVGSFVQRLGPLVTADAFASSLDTAFAVKASVEANLDRVGDDDGVHLVALKYDVGRSGPTLGLRSSSVLALDATVAMRTVPSGFVSSGADGGETTRFLSQRPSAARSTPIADEQLLVSRATRPRSDFPLRRKSVDIAGDDERSDDSDGEQEGAEDLLTPENKSGRRVGQIPDGLSGKRNR